MKKPTYYRGKLQFQTRRVKGKVAAGLFAENSHRLVPVMDCLVQDKTTQAIVNRTAELLDDLNIPIYDERKEQGVRTVMVRRARKTGQVHMIFVLSRRLKLGRLIQRLTEEFPAIRTIAVNIQPKKT
ncbi:23S rRNA (uracil-5-)-methyltransferase RumA, partial [Streptococcus danieliae]|nr:23S rRNA (uracil-5-)-methyltransferase RumA [Streptococcus danieliae]